MPNALDLPADAGPHRFLVLGATGAGKTTQFLTLPGKKFAYLFDPNATRSLMGFDVDFEEFAPSVMNLDTKSLTKDKGDTISHGKGSDVYLEWERDYEQRRDSGFFTGYQWLMMDSATTFLDLIMDRVLTLNGRPGQWPNQDDYGPQMMVFTKVVRELTRMGLGVYFTGHLQTEQNAATKVFESLPMLTGRLREKIPLLFSDIYGAGAEGDDTKGSMIYTLRTAPSRMLKTIRCSIKVLGNKGEVERLAPVEDVTIDWNHQVTGQGLGKLLELEQAYLRSMR